MENEQQTWKPGVSSYEWYAKWALERYAPCEQCLPEYRVAYAKMHGLMEAAETCFQLAYAQYAELTRMSAHAP